jgi:hypothetical protein
VSGDIGPALESKESARVRPGVRGDDILLGTESRELDRAMCE